MNKLIKHIEDLDFLTKESISKISSIFSSRTGIINAILERRELSLFGLYMFQSLSANTSIIFNRKSDISSGGLGVGFTKEKALWSCIGESIERYCMSYYDLNDIFNKKLKDLPLKNRLSEFDLYTESQYKREKKFLNPKLDSIDWVKLKSFRNENFYIYYPASLIYLPFENSKPVAETSSTGVAAGKTILDAIKNSILEIIERDSVMINFTVGLCPPEVDLTNIENKHLGNLIKKIRKSYQLITFSLYSDINIPVYMSLIWRKYKNKLHYGIGASVSFDSDKAILKSLEECLFTYFYSKNILDLKQNNPDKIKTLYEHFLYYQDPELFQFLIPQVKTVEYVRSITTLSKLLKEFEKNNLKIFYKDLTTIDIRNTGIKVVKVVIPGMIDLNKTHRLIRKGARRFKDVPTKLGFKNKISFSDLPHPFP